jgi:hypothetical protein
MDALVIFACIFTATFVLNMLSAGRDQLLFLERDRARRWVTVVLVVSALFALMMLGMPLKWALALVLAGPTGSALGRWVGSGDWIVLSHRLSRGLRGSD